MRVRRRICSSAIAAVLSLTLGVTVGMARPTLAAGGPFTCAPGFFQVLSGQLNKLNPVTGVYTPVGATYADTYNAMGYNTLDNFLYAMDTSGHPGHLLKIASDGSVADLGLPAGLPAANYIAGDFDNTGHLIIQGNATTWYSINVSTITATTLTITGSTGTSNDLVWVGGFMYGLSGAGSPTLRSVNLSTLVATTATVSGSTLALGSGAYGAGWSDSPNDLFFSDNSGNGIFSITGYSGGSPAGTFVAPGAVTGNNDGAACKLADSPFNSPTAHADSYNVAENSTFNVSAGSGVTANDAGSQPLTTTLVSGPAHGILTLNSDGSLTYTPTRGYTGTDTFIYFVTDPFGRTSGNATVTVTIFAPIGVPNAGSASSGVLPLAPVVIALGMLLVLRAMRRREASSVTPE